MKAKKLHGLSRPKIRQSWNKYNLFNLIRFRARPIGASGVETFFQQKWRAKGLLRGYHGEHIVERKWTRMFSRRLLGVVNMDPKYMAKHDGSEMAAGRGSGLDPSPRPPGTPQTPYMQMTFAPMERRLDIAVFRALFASSARQARQFCVHGAVKVNGKVVPYPAYRLNPGDMFQVDPEHVLYATGAPKVSSKVLEERALKAKKRREYRAKLAAEKLAAEQGDQESTKTSANKDAERAAVSARRRWVLLGRQARWILKKPRDPDAPAQLSSFAGNCRRLLAREGLPNATPKDLARGLATHLHDINLKYGGYDKSTSSESESWFMGSPQQFFVDLTEKEVKKLELLLAQRQAEVAENIPDRSKPYATPWRPRPFMAPFAFIPSYLEVNQKICSAVYLRHPVARPGSAEVPTPFPITYGQLGFNWYLRRR